MRIQKMIGCYDTTDIVHFKWIKFHDERIHNKFIEQSILYDCVNIIINIIHIHDQYIHTWV